MPSSASAESRKIIEKKIDRLEATRRFNRISFEPLRRHRTLPMRVPVEQVAENDDLQTLSAIADGDADAFQRFYRRYSSIVYSLSLRITGQDHDAEDVVSDVFWELWEKSARYNPSKSSPFTYLIMLTRCRALDRKRGLARREAHAILDWATDSNRLIDSESATPELTCSLAEQLSMVRWAIE